MYAAHLAFLMLVSLSAPGAALERNRIDDLPRYSITVEMDPASRSLRAVATVFLAAVEVPRERIDVSLSEQMRDVRIEVLAPAAAAGVVEARSFTRPFLAPGSGTTVWTAMFPEPVPAGVAVTLRVYYHAQGGAAFGFGLGEVSFGVGAVAAWYPVVEESPTMQLQGLRGTGTLRFDAPPGTQVYMAGRALHGAADAERGSFAFEYDVPATFSFAAGPYVTATRPGAPTIALYQLRPRATAGEVVERSAQILAALAAEFSPYPYAAFAIVEIPDELAGETGWHNGNADGFMITTTSALEGTFNTANAAHEIAHQWWGHMLQRTGPRGYYMLDEAMAQFGSLRAVELVEGAAAAENYRRHGYPGFPGFRIDYSGRAYLQYLEAGFDAPLEALPLDYPFLAARIANSKGMLVWDMLSRTLGRAKFSRIMREILAAHRYSRVTWDQFLEEVEVRSGRKLNWFYDYWFRRPGAPSLYLAWRLRDGALDIEIVQGGTELLRGAIDVEARGENGAHARRSIDLTGTRVAFDWNVPFPVTSVVLDPSFNLLHWTPEYRAEARALLAHTQGDWLSWRGQTDAAVALLRAGLDSIPEPDTHATRFLLEWSLARALMHAGRLNEAKAHAYRALAATPSRPEFVPWVYVQLARIAQAQGDKELLRHAVARAQEMDRKVTGGTGASGAALSLLLSGR